MSEITTPSSAIYKGAFFIDNSHYDKLFQAFEQEAKELPPCKSDVEKVKKAQSSFQWVDIPLKYFTRLGKSTPLSTHFRNTGNQHYKKKEIPQALRLYNLALLFSETEEPLGLAYANRSALFMAVGEYGLALKDCENGIVFIQDLKVLEKLSERKRKLEELLRTDVDYFEHMRNQGREYLNGMLRDHDFDNEELIGASRLVELQFDQVKGRKLIAKGDIPAGTPTLTDPGFTLIPDKLLCWDTDHCSECGQVMVQNECVGESVWCSYCSEECYSSSVFESRGAVLALSYFHSVEHLHSDCLLIYKIVLKVGEEKLYSYYTNDTEFNTNTLNPTEYPSIYNLITHYDQDNRSSLFKSILLANLIFKFNFKRKDPEFLTFVASLIYRHLNNLQYNVITLSEWSSPEGPTSLSFWEKRARQDNLELKATNYATIVCTLIAITNHSCDPNCVFIKNPRVNVGFLITTRRIGKGEELTISYKLPFKRIELKERQEWLLKYYKFDCNCSACLNNLGPLEDKRMEKLISPELLENLQIIKQFLTRRQVRDGLEMSLRLVNEFDSSYDVRNEEVQVCQEVIRRVMVEMGML